MIPTCIVVRIMPQALADTYTVSRVSNVFLASLVLFVLTLPTTHTLVRGTRTYEARSSSCISISIFLRSQ